MNIMQISVVEIDVYQVAIRCSNDSTYRRKEGLLISILRHC